MKTTFIYFSLYFFLFSNLIAQQYVPVTFKKDNYFYNHTVIEGNSLFNLQKIYACPAEDILNANEGIERGLDVGEVVFIPVHKKTITHIVSSNESIYSLSRLFSVPIDSIVKHNLISGNELKIGQRLSIKDAIIPILKEVSTNSEGNLKNIPSNDLTSSLNSNLMNDDLFVLHTVQSQESLYTISKRYMVSINDLIELNNLKTSKISPNDVLKIKLKEENKGDIEQRNVPPSQKTESIQFPSLKDKKSLSVALFLPFNLDSRSDINKSISNAAIEYYMGAKLAIDSLSDLGFKAEFFIYDYFDKTKSLQTILEQKSFLSTDLIIAPLHQKEAEIVAEWALKNNVKMIYSVTFSNFLFENKNAYAMVTNNNILLEKLAVEMITTKKDQQLVLVKSGNAADDLMYQHFLSAFRAEVALKYNSKIIEANYDNYKLFTKNGRSTCFIFLSNEKEKVIALLNHCKENELFQVVGLKEWIEFKEINSEIKNKFSFYYMAPSYFSYNDPALKTFHKLYRKKYNADLTKMACLGYDVVYNACKYFMTDEVASRGLISNFSFVENPDGKGFQNTGCFLLKFEDFESKITFQNE
ncbi:MAG: LysM peptidoglycan-binding domain-containing protein [Flavobacteriales bacterium]|nr:LysM peptidoglycan-binding domain-containing protein [Flavobacteriales bacterium]